MFFVVVVLQDHGTVGVECGNLLRNFSSEVTTENILLTEVAQPFFSRDDFTFFYKLHPMPSTFIEGVCYLTGSPSVHKEIVITVPSPVYSG